MIQLLLFVPLAILFVLNSPDCDCDCDTTKESFINVNDTAGNHDNTAGEEEPIIEELIFEEEPIIEELIFEEEPIVNPRFFMFEQNITNIVSENKSIKIKIKNNEFTFVYS